MIRTRPEQPQIQGACHARYQGTVDTIAEAKEEAEKIGYPVMIKASAGGGGKYETLF